MSVEVVCGPMFSGKSTHIYSIVKRFSSIGLRVLVLKPSNDNRYTNGDEIVTHDNIRCKCYIPGSHLMEVPFNVTNEADVIIVEEAQFFHDLLVFVKSQEHKHVVVVGLDGDFNRKPFGQVLECIPLADKVTKLTAMCEGCADGTPALFTYRKEEGGGQVLVGGSEKYSALCRKCYLNSSFV